MPLVTNKELRNVFGPTLRAYSEHRKAQEAILAPIRRADSMRELVDALIDTPGDSNLQIDAALKRNAYLDTIYPK